MTKLHFERAVADIAAHGDNDTLPFDVDNRFVKDRHNELADLAYRLSTDLAKGNAKSSRDTLDSSNIFFERLLAPTGLSGFRIVTKIHPFWAIYYNGLGVAIAEALEPLRSNRAHSYRFAPQGEIFDRDASWRAYRLATIEGLEERDTVVVQTDISSFYERISHHRLENCVTDLFSNDPTVAAQVDRLLNRFASGRSFGLPVGGQGSRVLAELLLSMIDQQLDAAKLDWRRYVDDFVLVTESHADAYRAISVLSHALADYGLSLNRNKTTVLSAKHYRDYVQTQLGLGGTGEGQKLLEIDLHFDPYSDDPDGEFQELKNLVETLDIATLLDLELSKSQPDTFLVSQVGRTLRLHEPALALQLCRTLLSERNLHAFRASWSTIMRGVVAVCTDLTFESIFGGLDALIDAIPDHSSHLLTAEASCLHYLRVLRARRTPARTQYVQHVFSHSKSHTVRRACMDCWRSWKHRAEFTSQRNQWDSLTPEEQRMLWLAADAFGDEGQKFRKQVGRHIPHAWKLGFERQNSPSFASIFLDWSKL